ncbi:MAG: phosphoribosylglycinamide formyltransferase [Fimbriimonadaceae bacterium]|nr:phosphoribosylglycinamide formyltransferase [Fimbriimonadaceae bacterium]
MGRIGILVGAKGRGGNMAAIATACCELAFPGRIVQVVSPRSDAPAIARAHGLGLPTRVVPYGPDFTSGLIEAFSGCDVVCLAGFMRLVPTELLNAHPRRVLNIHPALLPKFGGKGMFGMHVHEAVIAARERESGCTVHVVTPVYDEGEVIVQRRCPVLPGDSAEDLAARVTALEHEAYPEAIRIVLGS